MVPYGTTSRGNDDGETSNPTVIAVFRLAIAEAAHAPEVAQALNAIGVEPSRAALREIMSRARSAGLLGRG
jgi:hypothetical protein